MGLAGTLNQLTDQIANAEGKAEGYVTPADAQPHAPGGAAK